MNAAVIVIAAVSILPTIPGAINPHVTQANIHSTICKSGWTKTVRPPSAYTTGLKKKQLKALGYADQKTRDFEEDHAISLEIGGAPSDPMNLWPEPYRGKCGARRKDILETRLKHLVCEGKFTLKQAQDAISSNWIAAYRTYVGPLECGQ